MTPGKYDTGESLRVTPLTSHTYHLPLEPNLACPHTLGHGGDLVSTWVAKPEVHAEGQITS